ncbi:MAG: flagellar hook-basal body complex protein FliE [Anaerolineae bacterium]|nr:flagellar hook-basal body complex protein FliE [Phycisphaerae bacterium]
MIDGISNISKLTGVGNTPGVKGTGEAGGSSFSDVLKDSIDEVSKLQQDASQAVSDLATGKTEDVTGVMSAMEKSDIAFKTLLSIRAKLMDAYEEIKSMPI